MSIAMVSTITSFGIYALSSLRSSSEEVKLGRDVAVLNRALRQYEMAGGSLAGVTDPQAVLDKLKTKLTGSNRKEMAGLRGSMVDKRLKVELQDTAEAATSKPRARYVSASRQFEVVNSGGVAIRRFAMDDSLATHNYGNETRATTYKLATVENWVWDYNENSPTRSGPALPPAPGAPPADVIPPDVTLPALLPPTYSMPSGTYQLRDYPLRVTITDTNPANVSTLQFSTSGGPFAPYTSPPSFDPGAIVSAFATPLDPDSFEDSGTTLRDYRTTPETPDLRLSFGSSNLSYEDLGGPMEPSGVAGLGVLGRLVVNNRNAFPDVYESSAHFEPRWTTDGSDPLTSSTAVIAPAFSGGYLGNDIPVVLADWPPASDTVTISAAIKTLRPEMINDSPVRTAELNRQVRVLAPPEITFVDRDGTLTLDTARFAYPMGTRIYYTITGVDPGNNAGEPVSGTLYTGPFLLAGAYQSVVSVTARAYPPVAWKPWFTTSNPAAQNYTLPADVDIYIGGEFEQSGGMGSPMRNIARLSGRGTVDTRFNTGSGAAAGSLVGVVRQSGGGVMAGGDFDSVNGVARPGLVRLQPNGVVDPGFDAGLVGGR